MPPACSRSKIAQPPAFMLEYHARERGRGARIQPCHSARLDGVNIAPSMTLPGIAGFVLTMGIGVDSNVLIFERIKEELEAQRVSGHQSMPVLPASSGRSSTPTSLR